MGDATHSLTDTASGSIKNVSFPLTVDKKRDSTDATLPHQNNVGQSQKCPLASADKEDDSMGVSVAHQCNKDEGREHSSTMADDKSDSVGVSLAHQNDITLS